MEVGRFRSGLARTIRFTLVGLTIVACAVSPIATATPSASPPPTQSASPSGAPTQSASPSDDPTQSASPSDSPTESPSPTIGPTPATTLDDTRIAFVSHRRGNGEIYVMNVDGSHAVRLTNNPAEDGSPAWSPDGTRIAFSRQSTCPGCSDTYVSDIYAMDADGSNGIRLTPNRDWSFQPAWSPDGTMIAFASDGDGDNEIYVMQADGSYLAQLTENGAWDYGPAWSPDGNMIAFHSDIDGDDEIYVIDIDGAKAIRLTDNDASDFGPAWSPDGTRIAFVSDRAAGYELYVMEADGSGVARLTNDDASDESPAWSPDGSKIAFASDRDSPCVGCGELYDIYVMDADGSNVLRLTQDEASDASPAWSPFVLR